MFLRRLRFLVILAVFFSTKSLIFSQQIISEICVVAKSDTPITSLAWSPDSKIIVSTWNKKVVLWDSQTGKKIKVHQEHTKPAKIVRFNKNGNKILSVGKDNTVIIRDTDGLTEPVRAAGSDTSPINDAIFSSDNTSVILPINGNAITQYLPLRYTNQYVSKPIFETDSLITSLDASDNSSLILVATKNGNLYIFNIEKNTTEKTFLYHTDSGIAPKISSDGKLIVSASDEKNLTITSVKSDTTFNIEDSDSPANCATFSPNGKFIAYATKNGGIKIYNLQSKTFRHNFIIPATPDEVLSLSFSPNSKVLLAGTKKGQLLYLNLENENLITQGTQPLDDSDEQNDEEKEKNNHLKHALELGFTVNSLNEKYYHVSFGLSAAWKSYTHLPFYYGAGLEVSCSPPDKNYPYKTSYEGIELNNPWLYRGHLFACVGLGHYFERQEILLFGEGRIGIGGNLLFNNEIKHRRTSNTAGCIVGDILAGVQWKFLTLNGGVEFDSSLGVLAKGGLGAVIHFGKQKTAGTVAYEEEKPESESE